MFHQENVFLFETLHITPRRHICLTQAVILSSTSNFIATKCAFIMTSSQKLTNIYVFCLRHPLYLISQVTWFFFRGFKTSHL